MNANMNVDNALKTGSLLEKTESEQLNITDKTDKEQAEQAEENEQVDNEQTGDEEQIELKAKIDEIDAKIEQYRVNAVQARKEQSMRRFNYSDEQIQKYVKFVEGDTADEIDRSVLQLSKDIAPNNYYGDPSINNGAASKPKAVDKKEVGRNAAKRILSKIRL